MKKIHYIIILATLFLSTLLFTIYVFIPTIQPYEIVDVSVEVATVTPVDVNIEPEKTLKELFNMQENQMSVLDAKILNRDLPSNWVGKKMYFKYTYIGEYTDNTAKVLDDLLVGEYKWQKQLDAEGNIVMGGIILSKDGTYQLHTHNSFTKGNRFYLLGDILDRYFVNGILVGTQIQIGDVILEAIWEKDTEVLKDGLVPYADLVISTCLERYGDRRLVSGWNIVEL